ncbi:hypothetical protein [Enterocloster lavalensis]|uniref:hypothetical protein n=1 Tax=Enterocloster lavalensis TaxID=460384 RepID=UPI002A82DDBF|nr:hypothetical protein [Enterocloster lavalensis]
MKKACPFRVGLRVALTVFAVLTVTSCKKQEDFEATWPKTEDVYDEGYTEPPERRAEETETVSRTEEDICEATEDPLIIKDTFMPSSRGTWNSILKGESNTKLYNSSDGEWVIKDNKEKFKVDGVYVASAYVKEDDQTYYWITGRGNKGRDGSIMEFKPDDSLVNFDPGRTEARDLAYADVPRGELYPAILNSIFLENYPDEYKLDVSGTWDNGLFYDYGFRTNEIGYINIDVDNYKDRNDVRFELVMSSDQDQLKERINFALLLLSPLADEENIINAINMFDYTKTNNRQEYVVDGYFSEIQVIYLPYPGSKFIITNY